MCRAKGKSMTKASVRKERDYVRNRESPELKRKLHTRMQGQAVSHSLVGTCTTEQCDVWRVASRNRFRPRLQIKVSLLCVKISRISVECHLYLLEMFFSPTQFPTPASPVQYHCCSTKLHRYPLKSPS